MPRTVSSTAARSIAVSPRRRRGRPVGARQRLDVRVDAAQLRHRGAHRGLQALDHVVRLGEAELARELDVQRQLVGVADAHHAHVVDLADLGHGGAPRRSRARAGRPPARPARRGRRRRRCRARRGPAPRPRRRSRGPGRRPCRARRRRRGRRSGGRPRGGRARGAARAARAARPARRGCASSASVDVRSISTCTDCHISRSASPITSTATSTPATASPAGVPGGDEDRAREHGERAREVGGEVDGVGGQRRRAVAARAAAARDHARDVDGDHDGEHEERPPGRLDALGRRRRRSRCSGLVADRERDEQQHRALGQRGQVLRLAVAVVVLLVGRPQRHAHGEQRQQRRDEVGRRVRGLGEEGDRAGGQAGAELERDEEAAAATLNSADAARMRGAAPRARPPRRRLSHRERGGHAPPPRAQPGEQRACRAAAVRDRVLLGVGQLGHRAAVVDVVGRNAGS